MVDSEEELIGQITYRWRKIVTEDELNSVLSTEINNVITKIVPTLVPYSEDSRGVICFDIDDNGGE